VVAGGLGAALVVFRLAYPSLGALAGAASLLPSLIAAMRMGTWPAVVSSAVSCLAMNAVLLVSGLPMWSLPLALGGTVCLVATSLLVGRMQTLQHRVAVAEREAALAAARARVSTAERLVSLGTLAAGVAHEVNNPLAFVLANLRFAREVLESGETAEFPEAIQALVECEMGAERVRSIISDMKRLSRNGTQDHALVDVSVAVASAVNLVPRSERRAALSTHLAEVPRIEGSDAQVAQVVLNLVMNALQAFEVEAPENRVTVSVELAPDGQVAIVVEDNGAGIPLDVQPRVFDPFFTTKPPGVGTGLGLPLCQSFVVAMGGTIGFKSEPGHGTRFEVRFPAAASQASA
jgi:signal transduction histidine kinase